MLSDDAPDMELPDRIAATFTGRTVFITGGTGFMGKVLVEKLLSHVGSLRDDFSISTTGLTTNLSTSPHWSSVMEYALGLHIFVRRPVHNIESEMGCNEDILVTRKCPDIREILLLVRKKKGVSPQDRLLTTFSDPLFEKVTAQYGGLDALLSKVTAVPGDAGLPALALSEPDRLYLTEHVDIVVHAAATIRFDEALKKAILLNVRGTKLVLDLARECKKLKLFIHISTAYCHLHEPLLEEKPYAPPANPHHIMATAEVLDDATVESIAPRLLNKLPNSYAFTKALGEALAVEAMKDLPLIILRPSIVIPIWREPVPGWTDNINGPTGLLIGAGKGVIRSMYCRSDSYADYLPVDVFINGIMVSVWNYITNGDTVNTIFNFTSSAEVKVTWEQLIETGREIILNRVPLNGVVWYPGGSMKHSRALHSICVLLFHWLPAILVDTLLFILRFDPILIRVQKRISKGFEVFEYYTTRQWDFVSERGQRVRTQLNAREREDYKVDSTGVNISKYFEDCIRAARLFILKQSDDTIPAAKRHMKIMWAVDLIVRYLFMGFVLWTLARWSLPLFSNKQDQLQVI